MDWLLITLRYSDVFGQIDRFLRRKPHNKALQLTARWHLPQETSYLQSNAARAPQLKASVLRLSMTMEDLNYGWGGLGSTNRAERTES